MQLFRGAVFDSYLMPRNIANRSLIGEITILAFSHDMLRGSIIDSGMSEGSLFRPWETDSWLFGIYFDIFSMYPFFITIRTGIPHIPFWLGSWVYVINTFKRLNLDTGTER